VATAGVLRGVGSFPRRTGPDPRSSARNPRKDHRFPCGVDSSCGKDRTVSVSLLTRLCLKFPLVFSARLQNVEWDFPLNMRIKKKKKKKKEKENAEEKKPL